MIPGGKWFRPGPEAEASLLGRWPSTASGVWSDALWQATLRCRQPYPGFGILPVIGCDVARFGDDYTAFHVRWGGVSLHHESHNGWDTGQTAGHLKVLARHWAAWCSDQLRTVAKFAEIDPKLIPCNVDDDGVGGGVIDQAGGFNFQSVCASCSSLDPDKYPNLRCELWFAARERAKSSRLDISRLDKTSLSKLQQQLLAPKWKLDAQGRRVVEPKADTKDKLGRSPDDADAFNLAFFEMSFEPPERIKGPEFKRGKTMYGGRR